MTDRLKTIGLVRFSVLTSTYYSERFDSLDALAAHLFAPERMELRFRLFERLCLRSLAAQTDPDFTLIIAASEDMPEPYLRRLDALLAPYPHIVLHPMGTGKHYQMLRAAYDAVPLDGAGHRLMFRLDDDDAVDLNFIRRTKALAGGLLKLHDTPPPTVIANNRGFYVRFGGDGSREVFDTCERAPLSAGVALLAAADHNTNPYRYVHRKFAQHYNTYSDITVPGFIRTIHGDNKSNPTTMGLTHKLSSDQIEAELRQHFDLGIDDLKAL